MVQHTIAKIQITRIYLYLYMYLYYLITVPVIYLIGSPTPSVAVVTITDARFTSLTTVWAGWTLTPRNNQTLPPDTTQEPTYGEGDVTSGTEGEGGEVGEMGEGVEGITVTLSTDTCSTADDSLTHLPLKQTVRTPL